MGQLTKTNDTPEGLTLTPTLSLRERENEKSLLGRAYLSPFRLPAHFAIIGQFFF